MESRSSKWVFSWVFTENKNLRGQHFFYKNKGSLPLSTTPYWPLGLTPFCESTQWRERQLKLSVGQILEKLLVMFLFQRAAMNSAWVYFIIKTNQVNILINPIGCLRKREDCQYEAMDERVMAASLLGFPLHSHEANVCKPTLIQTIHFWD